MIDDQVDPTEDEGAAESLSAVDEQAQESTGTTAERAPEVPDGATAAIARAEEHIRKLNMEKEREAAKRATKDL